MHFFKPKFWDKNQITFFSVLFFPISLLIKCLSFLKRLLTKAKKSNIPVICVGNIYLGGTGKTPLCIKIFSMLKKSKMKPAFIRKKYESFQDEADLQRQSGPVYQNSKRIEAIKEAEKNGANVVILDDGFQDFSIIKDLSIICFNEKQWIGNGLTIPAGPLRESISALKRAHYVIINGKKNQNIENIIFNKNKLIKIFYINYKTQNIEEFQNKKIIAFAGIGNPENFFNLLKDNKLNIIETIKFPDHHKYSKKELENLLNKMRENNATLITTEKDHFRISENYKKYVNILKIKVDIENEDLFFQEIKKNL